MDVLIYKYLLDHKTLEAGSVGDGVTSFIVEVEMPSTLLAVRWQSTCVAIWYNVGDAAPSLHYRKERRRFWVIGTGRRVRLPRASYLGTVEDPLGFIWHVFGEDYPVK